MNHSKENLISLLQTILSSLDKHYDSLSDSSLEYIHSNLKIIHTIVSSSNKSNTNINKEDETDLPDLSASQLLLKLNHSTNNTEINYNLDDLDDLIDY